MSKTPKTLTVLETHQLLDKLLCHSGTERQFALGVRNYTMAVLMLDAGLRVGEVVQLLIGDLYYNLAPVTALRIRAEISKNKTERTVPLSTRLSQAIVQMAELYWEGSPHNSAHCAFYNTVCTVPITPRQVQRIFERTGLTAFGRKVNPHVLRHTFATKLMRVTNARTVQELLGHKHLTSTQVYTHPNEDDKKQAIQKATCEKTDANSQNP